MSDDTKIQLNVKVFNQGVRNGCWLAAYQMLLCYEKRKHSEQDIKKAFKKAGINFKDAYDKGLDEGQFPDACAALDLRTGGVLPFGTGKAEKGGVKVLYKWFNHGGPLWVAGNWVGYKHIKVVCGADTKNELLCSIDPWSRSGVTKSTPQWVDFDKYVSKIRQVKGGTQYP